MAETVDFIDWLINEVKFQKREFAQILNEACLMSRFDSLSFLKVCTDNLHNMPFPKAWEKSVDDWPCKMEGYDKSLIRSMSDILGAFQAESQIKSLKQIKEQIKRSLKEAEKTCKTKGKMSKTLGILISLGTFILII